MQLRINHSSSRFINNFQLDLPFWISSPKHHSSTLLLLIHYHHHFIHQSMHNISFQFHFCLLFQTMYLWMFCCFLTFGKVAHILISTILEHFSCFLKGCLVCSCLNAIRLIFLNLKMLSLIDNFSICFIHLNQIIGHNVSAIFGLGQLCCNLFEFH